MTTVVIVLLVIYVLGLLAATFNRGWVSYAPYFNLVGALLLIPVVIRVFAIARV